MLITFNCQQLVSIFFAYVNVIDVCSSEVPLLTSCGLLPAPLLLFVASYTVFCLMSPQAMFLSRECQCIIVYECMDCQCYNINQVSCDTACLCWNIVWVGMLTLSVNTDIYYIQVTYVRIMSQNQRDIICPTQRKEVTCYRILVSRHLVNNTHV